MIFDVSYMYNEQAHCSSAGLGKREDEVWRIARILQFGAVFGHCQRSGSKGRAKAAEGTKNLMAIFANKNLLICGHFLLLGY